MHRKSLTKKFLNTFMWCYGDRNDIIILCIYIPYFYTGIINVNTYSTAAVGKGLRHWHTAVDQATLENRSSILDGATSRHNHYIIHTQSNSHSESVLFNAHYALAVFSI